MTLEEYKKYKDLYLQHSNAGEATKRNKRYTLDTFVKTLEEKGFTELDTEAFLAYNASMEGLNPNTRSSYMKTVKASLNWMKEMGFIQKNPVPRGLVGAERYLEAKRILTDEEIQTILSAQRPEGAHRKTFIQNHTIMVLFLTTGLRASELRALTPEDLKWGEGRIVVRSGKGKKGRSVPFMPIAQQSVVEYMNEVRPSGATNTMPLFIKRLRDGALHPIASHTLYDIVKRFLKEFTGKEEYSPHTLRHSCASILVTYDMNVKELQQVLGHSSLVTTERYAQLLCPDKTIVEHATDAFDKFMDNVASTGPGILDVQWKPKKEGRPAV